MDEVYKVIENIRKEATGALLGQGIYLTGKDVADGLECLIGILTRDDKYRRDKNKELLELKMVERGREEWMKKAKDFESKYEQTKGVVISSQLAFDALKRENKELVKAMQELSSQRTEVPITTDTDQSVDVNKMIGDGWIACSERLPDVGLRVLVHNRDGFELCAFRDDGRFRCWYGNINPTHWRPIPNLPEVSK